MLRRRAERQAARHAARYGWFVGVVYGSSTRAHRCESLQRKLEVLVQSVESAAEQGMCLSPVPRGGKRRLGAQV